MLKKVIQVVMACFITLPVMAFNPDRKMVSENFEYAAYQYKRMLKQNKDHALFPRSTQTNGSLYRVGSTDWTSGFYPGVLWYIYEYTHGRKWRKAATKTTMALKDIQYFTGHHDVGFMMESSFGHGLRLMDNKEYETILLNTAKSLCTRYSPTVQSIMSWNPRKSVDGKNQWDFPVIIDNLMNLNLLFLATELSGDSVYYKIAVNHAKTALKNHVRPDFSSFHVVNYDPQTGKVLHQQTAQGFSDSSTWARGQAWGVYGFTSVYKQTKDVVFLNAAMRMADHFLNHPNLPPDAIPIWDFSIGSVLNNWNNNHSNKFISIRDVSSACIMASALLDLRQYVDTERATFYYKMAEKMLKSLSTEKYRAQKGTNNNFMLMHSVGNFPIYKEIDTPLIYADYYFLEALIKYNNS